jgi:hypothetical protein
LRTDNSLNGTIVWLRDISGFEVGAEVSTGEIVNEIDNLSRGQVGHGSRVLEFSHFFSGVDESESGEISFSNSNELSKTFLDSSLNSWGGEKDLTLGILGGLSESFVVASFTSGVEKDQSILLVSEDSFNVFFLEFEEWRDRVRVQPWGKISFSVPCNWGIIEVAEKTNIGRANTSSFGAFSSSVEESVAVEASGSGAEFSPFITFSSSKEDSVKLSRCLGGDLIAGNLFGEGSSLLHDPWDDSVSSSATTILCGISITKLKKLVLNSRSNFIRYVSEFVLLVLLTQTT